MVSDITQLLIGASRGDKADFDALFARLYPELRQLARARAAAGEVTITPTVLVHEIYARMIGNMPVSLEDRSQFFGCAAHAMRCVLVDAARRRQAQKRGGKQPRITLTERMAPHLDADSDLMALDEALVDLRERQPRQAQVVELHYFAGLGFGELAGLIGVAERTAKRDWQRARAYLHAQLA